MLVDDVGDVTVTNDGATILQNLEVEHPAAKVLCELADLQVGFDWVMVILWYYTIIATGNKKKYHIRNIQARGCLLNKAGYSAICRFMQAEKRKRYLRIDFRMGTLS